MIHSNTLIYCSRNTSLWQRQCIIWHSNKRKSNLSFVCN